MIDQKRGDRNPVNPNLRAQTLLPKNWTRRCIGAAVALFPMLLLIGSIIAGINGLHVGLAGGMAVMIAAGLIAMLNFYLSLVRAHLYVKRHGSRDGYRHVSGFPLIGTVLVVIGVALGFGDIPTAVLGLVVMSVDTGGSAWFLIATWRDASFWDA
jgi:hypothetical protein